jgi:plasmid maintenance system killer protein
MQVSYRTNKLQKVCNDEKDGIRELGPACAKKLRQRLAELAAAEVLSDISYLPPPRCHELTNLGGVFSVALQHPYRLLFISANEPVPRKADNGIDLTQVTAIEITNIEDTHD